MTIRPTTASEALEAALNEGYSAVDNEWTVREMADLMDEALRDAGWALVPANSLDAAWAEAEAALPERGQMNGLHPSTISKDGVRSGGWIARVQDDRDTYWAKAKTPAAALRALTAKLREIGT